MKHDRQAERFAAAIPVRAYATNDLEEGIWKQDRAAALQSRYVQPNASKFVRYLCFDVDNPGAVFAARDGLLPPPTWTAENRANGLAHLGYELAVPVSKSNASRTGRCAI